MKEPSSIIERTQDVLAWYQTKIGNYDKQMWEQSVEQRILKGLENRPKKKDGNLNHGLIDVDLVRGSAFTKAKPQHHWSAVLRKGIQRVLLFPCYTSWWQQHTSKHVTSLLFLVYVMQITQLVLILCYDKVFEEVHMAEVIIPAVLILFMGVLYSQIVSTYGSNKKSGAALGTTVPGRTSLGSTGGAVGSSVSGKRHGGHSRGLRSSKGKKQRMRPSQARMKTTNANNPTSLSPGESCPFDGETTGAEAEKLAVFITAKNKPVPDPVVWSKGAKGNATGSGPSTNGGRRRNRSWRFGSTTSECRESPLRSLPTSGSGPGLTTGAASSPMRSSSVEKKETESVGVYRNGNLEEKFIVETVPSDEEVLEVTQQPTITSVNSQLPVVINLQTKDTRSTVDTLLTAASSDLDGGLTGHSEDVLSTAPLVMPTTVDGELTVEKPSCGDNDDEHLNTDVDFQPTASPVDSAFAESDVAKKSGSSSRTSSASSADSKRHSSRAESSSSSFCSGGSAGEHGSPKRKRKLVVRVTEPGEEITSPDGATAATNNSGPLRLEATMSPTLGDVSASPSVIVTPVSEESERDGDRKGKDNCHRRWRSGSPHTRQEAEEDSNLQPCGNVTHSCHESSNDDTYTSMSKRRVEFAHLFRLRCARRPRRSGGGGSGMAGGGGAGPGMEDADADGFEEDLADESSAEEDLGNRAVAEQAGGGGNSGGGGGGCGSGGGAGSGGVSGGGAGAAGGGGGNSNGSASNLGDGAAAASAAANTGTSAGTASRFLCDAERSPTHKSQASETEYDRINSDVGNSDTTSDTEDSENGEVDLCNDELNHVEDPFVLWFRQSQPKQTLAKPSTKDTISCYVWEGEALKKSDLTMLDIGWSIIQAVERCPTERHYIRYGLFMSVLLSLGPLLFRVYLHREVLWQLPHATLDIPVPQLIVVYMPSLFGHILFGRRWLTTGAVLLGVGLRCLLYLMLFFLLCVAERTFAQRLQYAKHFSYLTSSRRARKYYLPHFRLNKVSNIKSWLSLRSYLKKRGPQRSVDCIITSTFYIMLTVLALLCVHLLQASDTFLNNLLNWDLLLVAFAMGLFLLRFMTLGTKIMKKFRNHSVLITEQINLYLSMERKPHKKDELMLAKNVLKLAEELLKELDGPFRICGWSMNPLVYNIIKVVILSAFSAVLTEMLGFKLKLYKIKLNPINW